MKIVSFNVNGIRARLHQLQELVQTHAPDIIALQETKVHDDQFPYGDIEELGYHVRCYGQKGHYGVALLSRTEPLAVAYGFPNDGANAQRRLIYAEYPTPASSIKVFNGYFPQGENRDHPQKFPAKENFYADLTRLLENHNASADKIIVVGDMNVAPADADVGIGQENEKRWLRQGKCCFLPEERDWLVTLMDVGLHDTYRSCHPNPTHIDPTTTGIYSWFDYRSRGFERDPKRGLRIDLILANDTLRQHCRTSGIDYNIRAMSKPSDHCPVWAEFDL